jgi:hypothetical protein
MEDFISEDDLQTFDGWMRYQGVVPATPEDLKVWQGLFEMARKAAGPKVGLMKLQPVSGEHRFAVAVREGSDLWLTLWVRRSRKGEFFVIVPRGENRLGPSLELSPRREHAHENLWPEGFCVPETSAADRRFSWQPASGWLLWP